MSKYLLHYVGSKLYSEKVFIEEAKRLGVNRCLPLRQLKSIKFGDKILLATYVPKAIKQEQILLGESQEAQTFDKRKNKRDGTAKVFGYFTVSCINLHAPDSFKIALTSQLNIVETKDNNALFIRQCGTYILGMSHIITNSLNEVVSKIERLMLERNEKVKVFVSGEFTELNAEISPINFSRTVIAVEVVEQIPFKDVLNVIGYIYNYEKRLYIKKYEKRGRPRKEKKQC